MIVTPVRSVSPMLRFIRTKYSKNLVATLRSLWFTTAQLISVAHGRSVKDEAPDGQIFEAKQLEEIAAK